MLTFERDGIILLTGLKVKKGIYRYSFYASILVTCIVISSLPNGNTSIQNHIRVQVSGSVSGPSTTYLQFSGIVLK